MTWVLVTSNENKWIEAQRLLGRPLDRVSLDLPELQARTTREVALEKARAAFAALGPARPGGLPRCCVVAQRLRFLW